MAVSRFSSFRRIYRQRQKNHALDKHMRAEIFSLSLSLLFHLVDRHCCLD